MTLRGLLVQHDPLSDPGVVGSHLADRGVALDRFLVVEDYAEPDPVVRYPPVDAYDIIVLGGAPWSVYSPTVASWAGAEVELARRAAEAGTPVLGICFGAQVLATALGGSVSPAARPEVGWHRIESDRPDDIAAGPWMQFHFDSLTPPPTASELARSPSGSQAFRQGRCLAVQFHPEVDHRIVQAWIDPIPVDERQAQGIDEEAIRRDSERFVAPAHANARRLVDWFLDDVACR